MHLEPTWRNSLSNKPLVTFLLFVLVMAGLLSWIRHTPVTDPLFPKLICWAVVANLAASISFAITYVGAKKEDRHLTHELHELESHDHGHSGHTGGH